MAPTILIIGGGFSGVALTYGLTRLPWPDRVRIVIAERNGRFGRGAAYSTQHPAHLLNVPAGRMGALPDDEGHFLSWLRARDPSIAGDSFVPRSHYGEYLEHVFQEAKLHAGVNVTVETVHDDAVATSREGDRIRVRFRSGLELETDRVVLAIGNLPPRNVSIPDSAFFDDPAYTRDPWHPGALQRISGVSSALIVGTGLTMVDAVLALEDANPGAHFVAVSRHGLLPLSHRDGPTKPVVIEPSHALEKWDGSAHGLLRIIRQEVRAAERAGSDWRDIVNGLRPITHLLWRRMSPAEQARFFRHVRPYWDTHRHRMSTRVASAVNSLIARNQLSIVAGRITACTRDGNRVAVDVRRRDGTPVRYHVEAVVNCTGPDGDLARSTDPLVASLRANGDFAPDPLGLGMETTGDGAVVDARGDESETLFTLGSARRPGLWESTAVPELRAQADALARRLHVSLHHHVR